MFFVAWFMFTHVPARAAFGAGGTGVAVAACAGDPVSNAATATELTTAAVTARQVRFI
jgi:hypothetical protein